MKISLVIPAYNEEKNIKNTICKYTDFFKQHGFDYEIIAVDDGSTDKTRHEIEKCKDVICISYPKNQGKGYAVKRGVLRAKGDYVFFTDADLSYSPDCVLTAVSCLCTERANGVIGVRGERRDYPPLRRLASKIFCRVVKSVLRIDAPDTQCGFKGFDKSTARELFAETTLFGFGFDFEVLYLFGKTGKKLTWFPVPFTHRGESHIRLFSDSIKMLRDIIYLKFGKGGKIADMR